jgi:hypothetical protein
MTPRPSASGAALFLAAAACSTGDFLTTLDAGSDAPPTMHTGSDARADSRSSGTDARVHPDAHDSGHPSHADAGHDASPATPDGAREDAATDAGQTGGDAADAHPSDAPADTG